jgi:hypothetical protein
MQNPEQNKMTTTYQDIFNHMETIDPSTLSQQQDALASLFPGIPSLNSTMIDDWLADELCPSMSDHSSSVSQKTTDSPKTPCHNHVSLFPEINNAEVTPVAIVKQPAPVVTIMPKTSNLPRIAPRPSTTPMSTTTTPPVMMKEPTLKRKLMMEPATVVDQDEQALKRQKNTDAAR